MTNITKLRQIMDDLKNPRSYRRTKAIDELMALRDSSVIPHLFRMAVKETDFVKVQFCRFLGMIKGDMAVPPLIVFLLDKNEIVAKEAASSLDRIDSDKKSDALIFLMKKKVNQFSRLFAVRSLGKGKAVRAVPYLVELLSDGEDDVKEIAVEALRQIGDPASVKPLVKALRSGSNEIVYSVLVALGEIGNQRTGLEVMCFLDHENEKVRKAAVWAVARLYPEKAVPKFVKMLEQDASESIRQEIVKRLGKLGGPAAVRPLLNTKAFDKDHNVRIYAEWALSDIPLKDKEEALVEMAQGGHHVVRGEAILEIGKTGEDRFLKVLSSALKEDSYEYVRACAAEGLSYLRDPEVSGILVKAFGDTEGVRRRAADSLLKRATVEDEGAALDMVKGTSGDDLYLKDIGFRMLEKIYYEQEAPEPLLGQLYSLLKGQETNFQKLVIKCLGRIGNSGTLSFLKTYRPERTPELVVLGVVEAIERLQKKLKK